MLKDSDIYYCEKRIFQLIKTSKNETVAFSRLKKFKYKHVRLNDYECNRFLELYKSEYGQIKCYKIKTKRIK